MICNGRYVLGYADMKLNRDCRMMCLTCVNYRQPQARHIIR